MQPLAGVLFLSGLLAALPQAGSAGSAWSPNTEVMPSAQAGGLTLGDPSVPDAGAALAGRELADEAPAPTF